MRFSSFFAKRLLLEAAELFLCFCAVSSAVASPNPELAVGEVPTAEAAKQYRLPVREEPLTNLGVLRAYLVAWLRTRPVVNTDLHCMVRQLQPTEHGIPLELYFFSRIKDWVAYEGVQSDVFDYVLAIVPEFGLRIFQSPSGDDVQALIGSKSL